MKIGLVNYDWYKDKVPRWYICFATTSNTSNTFLNYFSLDENREHNWKKNMKNHYIGESQIDNILKNKLLEAKDQGLISEFIILENKNEVELIKDIEEFILLKDII